jgi:uncharacterized repeat protein (TIGR01451 family)
MGLLLLLLGWGSAAPARATSGTIDTPVAGPIIVGAGETLTIDAGGSVTTSAASTVGVAVQAGGTLNITGGSVTAGPGGLGIFLGNYLGGGTLNMTAGSVNSDGTALQLYPGSMATISGGSLNSPNGVPNFGTVTFSGCGLAVSGGVVTGVLLDGTPINLSVGGAIILSGAPPTITLTGANPLTVECHASFTDPGATARDACGGSHPATVSGSVDVSTPGSYTLTYSASAGNGNTVTQTRTVNVVDTTPPVITLNGSSTMTVECHSSFTDPGATANDACAGSFAAIAGGSVDVNTPGSYTLTYTAADPSGSAAAPVTRTVQVVDTTKPVVTPPANITQAADPGQCSASINPGTATASDTCAGALTPLGTRSDGKALTASYPVGTTTITWSASDPAGNKAAASQTVTVNDTEKPTIACPASITVPATSAGGALVSYPAPSANDNCGSPTVSSNPPSGSTFPIGTTTVTCKAIDAAGNSQACSFTVTVTVADLSLTMSASPNPVMTGSNLTYTLAVQNAGSQPALGVALADPLPAGASFASATANAGAVTTPKGNGGTVRWNVGTLASGQSATLTLVVKVGARAATALTNTASVSTSSVEINLANNSANVVTSVVARH